MVAYKRRHRRADSCEADLCQAVSREATSLKVRTHEARPHRADSHESDACMANSRQADSLQVRCHEADPCKTVFHEAGSPGVRHCKALQG